MSSAWDTTLRLLGRRDHSRAELQQKLKQRKFSLEEIQEALQRCQELSLQSDERFVESFTRTRIRQGYGPLKIIQELITRGVEREVIYRSLHEEKPDWVHYATAVLQKRNKSKDSWSYEELQKQQRFLLYRGFDQETITQVTKAWQHAVKE